MTICHLNDLSEGDEADVVRLESAGSIRSVCKISVLCRETP